MTTQIKFGTSGWRAVMAEEFTFAKVRRDPRFLGETFCSMAAEILAAHGITPLRLAQAAPTPAFAYAVIQVKADGIINFTASHNPPEYGGIKFSTPDDCPELPEVTKKIEWEIAAADISVASPVHANGNGAPRSQSVAFEQAAGKLWI
jgi:phosphoglucomutase